jgi:hypothetical protein
MEITLVLPIAGHKYPATFRGIFRDFFFLDISKFVFVYSTISGGNPLRIFCAAEECLGHDTENEVDQRVQSRVVRNLRSRKLKTRILLNLLGEFDLLSSSVSWSWFFIFVLTFFVFF